MDTLTRQARRKLRTTEAILDAAEGLLAERGWRGTTIEAIAERADVAVGSIYARFAGKDGVYLALAARALDANEAYLERAYASADSPLEQVAAVADAYLRFHRDHPLAFRLVGLSDLEGGPEQERAAVGERLDAMLGDLAAAVRRGVRAGEVRGDVDPGAAAVYLWGSWNGVIALHARGMLSERAFRRALATGRGVLLRGLAA